jgi:diadenosine tetraphosphatase ApaH/serine/threonine PP2A family protein phosphatase
MRILVISDIHANLTALEAVLADAASFDAVWCLGDLVGYGPDPNECIQLVCQLPGLVCLIGNHDAAVIGLIDIGSFNQEARAAVRWTQRVLTEASEAYLRSLPEIHVAGEVTLAHGSPRQPVWEYLLDTRTATQNFAYFSTPFCFVGHSHLPVLFQMNDGWRHADLAVPEALRCYEMIPRAIFNPGSVGQPRDRDPRAAYAIYDSEAMTWTLRRVAYEIPAVQERMLSAGLPDRHIVRLSAGW